MALTTTIDPTTWHTTTTETAPAASTQAAHPVLTGLGHGFADWIIGTLKTVYGFFDRNFIGALVAGIALYVVFAPDVAGTSRI
jgi:hypothetical protein